MGRDPEVVQPLAGHPGAPTLTPGQRPLTVVQMLPALGSGGVERGTVEIASALVAAGHRALVVAAGGRYTETLAALGAEWIDWPVGKKSLATLWRYVPRVRALLEETRADVLHLRSRFPAWVGYLAWRGLPAAKRPRLVTTVHGFYSVNPYSAVMTRGERVICVSDAVRRYVLEHYRADPARLIVIPRGIDPAAYARGYRPDAAWWQAWGEAYPNTLGKRWVTLPARLTRWKGQMELLAVLPELVRHFPDVHVLLVGGFDARRADYVALLGRAIEAANLSGHVTLTGERRDLKEILAASTAVLSLSTDPEAFGRTTLEALALGVPVLGYHHGGVAEQLAAIYPYGSIAVRDHAALLRKLTALLSGDAPPVTAPLPPEYTLAQMQQQTLAVYQSV